MGSESQLGVSTKSAADLFRQSRRHTDENVTSRWHIPWMVDWQPHVCTTDAGRVLIDKKPDSSAKLTEQPGSGDRRAKDAERLVSSALTCMLSHGPQPHEVLCH